MNNKQKRRFFFSLLPAIAIGAIIVGTTYGVANAIQSPTQVSVSNALNISNNVKSVNTRSVPGVDTVSNITLGNLTNLPSGLNASTYAIDFVSNTQLNSEFLNYINDNPKTFFTNTVTPTAEAPMIKTQTATFSISVDGSSVSINVEYLTGFNATFNTPIYGETSILIKGFNTTPTTMANKIDASKATLEAPSKLTVDSPSLLSFLRLSSSVSVIFQNAPQQLINNPQNIVVNEVKYPDDTNGTVTVNITTKNAMVPARGFQDITGDVLITGIVATDLPTITSTDIDLSSIPSDIINSSMYSIDAYNKVSTSSVLVDYMNQNPDLFITNAITNTTEKQFTNYTFRYTSNSLIMDCNYLFQYSANASPQYKQTSLTFTGFNTEPTSVNPTIVQNGYNLSTYFSNVLASNVSSNQAYISTLKSQLISNLSSLFVNYPNAFISGTKNSISSGLTISSFDDSLGTLTVQIPTVNSYSANGYENNSFSILITGFAVVPPTPVPNNATPKEISVLGIPGIDGSIFSIDIANSPVYTQNIETFMNANPGLFLDNPITNNNQLTSPTFRNLHFSYDVSNSSQLIINCDYLVNYDSATQLGEYLQTSFRLRGFNSSNTVVNSQFIVNENDTGSTGFYLQGFSNVSSSEIQNNFAKYASKIEQQLNQQKSLIFLNAPQELINDTPINILSVNSINVSRGEVVLNVSIDNAVVNGIYRPLSVKIKCSGFNSTLPPNSNNTTLRNVTINADTALAFFQNIFGTTGLGKGFKNDWLLASQNGNLTQLETSLKTFMNTNKSQFFNYPSENTQVTNVTFHLNKDTGDFNVDVVFNGKSNGVELNNIAISNAYTIVLKNSPNAATVCAKLSTSIQNSVDEISEVQVNNIRYVQLCDIIAESLNGLKTILPDAWYPQSGSFTRQDIQQLLPQINVNSSLIQIPAFEIGTYPDSVTVSGITIANKLYNLNTSTNQSKPSTTSSSSSNTVVWVCVGVILGLALIALVSFIIWWNWGAISGSFKQSSSTEDYSEYYDDYFDDIA